MEQKSPQFLQALLDVVGDVSRATIAALDPTQLIAEVVHLIQERFDLYYAGLFLVDREGNWTGEKNSWAVLIGGTGKAGRQTWETGHRLDLSGESTIARCISGGKALITLDVEKDVSRSDTSLLPGTRSELALPLISRGGIVGALTLQSTEEAAFNEADIAILPSIANQVASALENSYLFEKMHEALQRTEILYNVSRSLIAFEDLTGLLQTIVEKVAENLPADRTTLIGFELEAQEVTHFVKGGPGAEHVVVTPFEELWQGLSGWALREMKPALSPKDLPDPREGPEVQQRRAETNCGAIIVVPLHYQKEVIGTMTAINQPDQPNFTQHDVEMMVAMANQAAAAIKNAQLFQEQQRARRQLNQRIKELDCLNEIGRKIDASPPIPVFLQWLAKHIPTAMQHPEACLVAIDLEGEVFGDAEAIETPHQVVGGLRIGEQFIGRIYVAYTQSYDFMDTESMLLGDIVRRVSSYIENRRLFEQTQNVLAETETLYRTSRLITAANSIDQALAAVLEYARSLSVDRCLVLLLEEPDAPPDERQAQVRAVWNRHGDDKRSPGDRFTPADLTFIRRMGPNDQLVLRNVATTNQVDGKTRAVFQQWGVGAVAILPLVAGGRLLGWLATETTHPYPFPDREVEALQSIAGQTAVAVQNLSQLQASQIRARHEQALREITASVRGLTDPQAVLRTAVRELGTTLGRSTFVRLGNAEDLTRPPDRPERGTDTDHASQEGGA